METFVNLFLTSCPESLRHTAGQGPVLGTEQLHHHAVAHTLQALDHDALEEPETHEDHQPLDEVKADANEALTVQTDQHHPLPTEPERERDVSQELHNTGLLAKKMSELVWKNE